MGKYPPDSGKPAKNVITPAEQDSIEMKTAKMLAGSDGVFLYRFTAADEFSSLKVFYTQYRAGVLEKKKHVEISYQDISSPKTAPFCSCRILIISR